MTRAIDYIIGIPSAIIGGVIILALVAMGWPND